VAVIRRVVVATYQSVSGAGKDAMDELFQQTRAVFVSDPIEPKKFTKPHSEAVTIEFEKPISADEARNILRRAPGVLVIDKRENGGYITPYEAAGEDATYVSRLREDPTVEHGLVMWIVSDNLRKGAALNAVQIAELLVKRQLIRPKRQAA
jgi:aspartate-semialdehyde dehydrogenase